MKIFNPDSMSDDSLPAGGLPESVYPKSIRSSL
jgi:hypothetical protein